MFQQRSVLYEALEKQRNSKVVVYVTGDRPGMETQISSEVYDYFVNQLDAIGPAKKISLYLYTRGGDTLAAWSIMNLMRQFADEIEIIIPSKCHSSGTLMSLGANRIIMTKQATLGPIDPSINHPLNPPIPGASPDAKIPVSVEAIEGFIQLIKAECGFDGRNSDTLIKVLSDKVHPIVLGQVFRTKEQIKMLGRRLLSNQVSEPEKIEEIIKFLCSETGSHDYTIHRREALALGLNMEKPDDVLYEIIKAIYDDIENELELTSRFDPERFLGMDGQKDYVFKRCLIESINGGSYYFSTEGIMSRHIVPMEVQQGAPPVQNTFINNQSTFEGWKYEK